MATQIQFRRGSASQHEAFTGALGEVTVNTTNDSLHVHDGSTVGGFEAAKADLSNHSGVGVLTATTFSGNLDASSATINNTIVGGATTELIVNGDCRITGILTIGTSSITLDSTTDTITATNFNGAITGAVTGNADSATALETARDFSASGDATASAVSFDGTGNVDLALTLATVNSDVGSYGSTTQIPVVTVNAKGLVTAVSTASVGTALTVTSNSGSEDIDLLTESLAITGGSNITGTASANGVELALDSNITLTSVTANLTGDVTGNADTATALATSRTIELSGDVSGSASFDGSANATITTTIADDSHNHIIGNVDGLQSALDLKAPLASPALTGTPTAPTAVSGTNSTQVATTAFVSTAVANVIDSAPGALDTLNELAAALGDDANFSSTVTNSLALKAPLASPALTGTPTAPTASGGTNTTQVATTAFVASAIAGEMSGNAATATEATNFTVSANNSTNETVYPVFVDGATGTQGAETDTALSYNPSTNTLAAGTFNSTSDINLKKDIELIGDTHEILSQIRGVKFTWKETDKHSTGVIAQDVEKVLPELVDVSDKGIKSVNYQGLIGVLIEAVKYQQKQIDVLKEEINSLKS